MSPLETLRAIVRRAETERAAPDPAGVNSLNSFISSPYPAKTEGLAEVEFIEAPEPRKTDDKKAYNDINDLDSSVIGEGISGFLSHPNETNELNELTPAAPLAWVDGFAELLTIPAPTGFSPERWRRIIDATGVFMARWAVRATECGWSDLDVFGCDADRPDARFDCMGLVLLLDRREIAAIDEHGADLVMQTGAHQRYRLRPLPAATVSLWQLCAPAGVASRSWWKLPMAVISGGQITGSSGQIK